MTESVKVPSGLPIAIASWPTWIALESPSVTGVNPVALTLISARSWVASVATTVAASSRLSSRVTVSEFESTTTWLLVSISPSELTMKPDPAPVVGTEKGLRFDMPVVVIVTTDGCTWFTTRTIAWDCVRLTS